MTDESFGPWRVIMHKGLPLPVQSVGGKDRVRLDDVGRTYTLDEAQAEATERNKNLRDKWTLKRERAFADLQDANRALAVINSWGVSL